MWLMFKGKFYRYCLLPYKVMVEGGVSRQSLKSGSTLCKEYAFIAMYRTQNRGEKPCYVKGKKGDHGEGY
jgi:hypothetical protein